MTTYIWKSFNYVWCVISYNLRPPPVNFLKLLYFCVCVKCCSIYILWFICLIVCFGTVHSKAMCVLLLAMCISMSNKKRKEKASSVIWHLAPESHALVLSASSAQFCNLCLFSNWLDITTGLLHSTEHPWHSLDPGISRYYKVLEGTSRCLQTVQIDPFLFLHNNEARCL